MQVWMRWSSPDALDRLDLEDSERGVHGFGFVIAGT